jgi:hypothetical protein
VAPLAIATNISMVVVLAFCSFFLFPMVVERLIVLIPTIFFFLNFFPIEVFLDQFTFICFRSSCLIQSSFGGNRDSTIK